MQGDNLCLGLGQCRSRLKAWDVSPQWGQMEELSDQGLSHTHDLAKIAISRRHSCGHGVSLSFRRQSTKHLMFPPAQYLEFYVSSGFGQAPIDHHCCTPQPVTPVAESWMQGCTLQKQRELALAWQQQSCSANGPWMTRTRSVGMSSMGVMLPKSAWRLGKRDNKIITLRKNQEHFNEKF